MMKKIFPALMVSFLSLPASVHAEALISKLEILPGSSFVGEDVSVMFRAEYSNPDRKPEFLSLVEWNASGSEIKYHWPLTDDGKQGDEKAGDGIYSRVIQFKEKKEKEIHFWVTEETLGANTNPTSVFLHETPPQLQYPEKVLPEHKATLVIKSRPTFQEILNNAWQKIKQKFN